MYFFSGGLPIKFPGQSSYNQAANIGELREGFGDRAMIFANSSSTGVSLRNLGLSRIPQAAHANAQGKSTCH
jgi:hypothetical protein